MLHSTPRQRRREANRQRILQTAMAHVVANGFGALSINQLAKAVDYTPGALYRYFPSKDALIGELTGKVIAEFGVAIEAVTGWFDGPLEKVFASLLTYRELAFEAPNQFGLLSMLMADPRVLVPGDEDAAPVMGAMVQAWSPLIAALNRAADEQLMSEGESVQRAVMLFAAVHGLLQLRKQVPRVPELPVLETLIQTSMHTLLVGWGADPEVASSACTSVMERGSLLPEMGDRA